MYTGVALFDCIRMMDDVSRTCHLNNIYECIVTAVENDSLVKFSNKDNWVGVMENQV